MSEPLTSDGSVRRAAAAVVLGCWLASCAPGAAQTNSSSESAEAEARQRALAASSWLAAEQQPTPDLGVYEVEVSVPTALWAQTDRSADLARALTLLWMERATGSAFREPRQAIEALGGTVDRALTTEKLVLRIVAPAEAASSVRAMWSAGLLSPLFDDADVKRVDAEVQAQNKWQEHDPYAVFMRGVLGQHVGSYGLLGARGKNAPPTARKQEALKGEQLKSAALLALRSVHTRVRESCSCSLLPLQLPRPGDAVADTARGHVWVGLNDEDWIFKSDRTDSAVAVSWSADELPEAQHAALDLLARMASADATDGTQKVSSFHALNRSGLVVFHRLGNDSGEQTIEGILAEAARWQQEMRSPADILRVSPHHPDPRSVALQVREVARVVLRASSLRVAYLAPSFETTPAITGPAWRNKFAARVASYPAASSMTTQKLAASAGSPGGVVNRHRLAGGTRLLVVEQPGSSRAALRIAFVGGQLFEMATSNGLHTLLARLYGRASKKHDAAAVQEAMARLGANVTPFASQNTFGLAVDFENAAAHDVLALAGDLVRQPVWTSADFERERAKLLSELRAHARDGERQLMQLAVQELFSTHPYRLLPAGSVASVSALKTEQLQQALSDWYTPAQAVVTVVGDVNTEQVTAILTHEFGGPLDAALAARAHPVPGVDALPTGRVVVQASVDRVHRAALSFRGAALSDRDRGSLVVLKRVLEERGRAIPGFQCVMSFGFEPGWIVLSARSDAQSALTLSGALRALVDGLKTQKPSDSEIEAARVYVRGASTVARRRASSQAAELVLSELAGAGLASDENASTPDVLRASEQYLPLAQAIDIQLDPTK